MTGVAGTVLDCDVSYPVAELLSRPTVLELGGLGEEEQSQAVVVALVVGAVTSHFKRHWPRDAQLRHLTVIEEAHRLLARAGHGGHANQPDAAGQAARQFSEMLSEVRAYGEGVVVVDQVPTRPDSSRTRSGTVASRSPTTSPAWWTNRRSPVRWGSRTTSGG